MPIFEYRCKKCGTVIEFLEEANSREAHTCKKCGSRDMDKLLSSFALRSSGSSSSSSACPTGTCPLS
jgi:putative FmdB family regulatory protein